MPASKVTLFFQAIRQLTDSMTMEANACSVSMNVQHQRSMGHNFICLAIMQMVLATSPHLIEDVQDAEDEDADPTAGMYAKYDRCLHGPRSELTQPPLSVAFLRKFLTIIKRRARCAASHIHSQHVRGAPTLQACHTPCIS